MIHVSAEDIHKIKLDFYKESYKTYYDNYGTPYMLAHITDMICVSYILEEIT
jgi:hypothetical protein